MWAMIFSIHQISFFRQLEMQMLTKWAHPKNIPKERKLFAGWAFSCENILETSWNEEKLTNIYSNTYLDPK